MEIKNEEKKVETKLIEIEESMFQSLLADRAELQSLVGKKELALDRFRQSFERLNIQYQQLRSRFDEKETN